MTNTNYEAILESIRWNGIVVSPFNPLSKVYKCGNRYKCSLTNRYFNAKTNTIFQNSRIDLATWFTALQLWQGNEKITYKELATSIGVSYKTAYALLKKIHSYPRKSVGKATAESLKTADKMKLADWLQTLKKE